MTMIKLSKHLKKVVAISIFVLVANTFLQSGTASAAMIDLKQYYPNPTLYKNYYLEGTNFDSAAGSIESRSVLWFENMGGENFRRYNIAPEDSTRRCGWDALSWAGDNLTYSQTHEGCGGNNKDVIYSDPIKFLPRYWDDNDTEDWVYQGSTPVTTTKLDGSKGCEGVNRYTATVHAGYLDMGDGFRAIHWTTEQHTDWAEGDDFPWCVADSNTPWQEDYYMVEAIPVEGYTGITTAKGLRRTVGGNLGKYQETNHHDWDVYFAKWVKLPWKTDPGVTTGQPGDPGENNNNNNLPTAPKTGQIGIAAVALATLGGVLFLSAMGVKKVYRKKKGLPASKPKAAKPPKSGKVKPPEAPKSK
jgi:hypothetical protein